MWTQALWRCAMGIRLSKGSKTPVFSSPACRTTMAGSAGGGGKRLFERGGGEATLVVCVEADEVVGAEPEQAYGALDAAVAITAGEDADGRRARESAVFDIPSRAFEHGVARGGEAGDVSHLASGDEGEARAFRDAEQFL